MPVITDYTEVKDTYLEAAELNVELPVFCMEDRETLEEDDILIRNAASPAVLVTAHRPSLEQWSNDFVTRTK